jgi:hypothetical protein
MELDTQYGDSSDFSQYMQNFWRNDALRRERIRELEPRLRALRDFLIKAAGPGVKLSYRADLSEFPADLRCWPMDVPDLRTW